MGSWWETLRFIVLDNFTERAVEKIASMSKKAEHIVAVQVQKDTSPYVPFKTGSLDQRTRVVGNTIIYPGPYARYLYYGVKMVDADTGKGPFHYVDQHGNEFFRFRKGAKLRPTDDPLTYTKDFHKLAGPYWFERSKAQNLEKWERVMERAVNIFG